MHIAYYDESGDDGYPMYSSPHFSLSTLYLHYLNWKTAFERIVDFRRKLSSEHAFPVKLELHTKHFILNKNPYRALRYSDTKRVRILDDFCGLVGSLTIKIVNISICKPRITNPQYRILDTALKYSIQRIENDLDPRTNPTTRFLIITDPGRVGKMRKTTRKIQRINIIPSKFETHPYRREITTLIEDPLPKDSRDSYFIQMADLVAFVVYHYAVGTTGFGQYHNRMPSIVNHAKVLAWMDLLKPAFNLQATTKDPYGVVFHPTE